MTERLPKPKPATRESIRAELSVLEQARSALRAAGIPPETEGGYVIEQPTETTMDVRWRTRGFSVWDNDD